jgi:hypothetical protein
MTIELNEVDIKQAASDITQRINQLDSLSGESLKSEMSQLKRALLDNPAACALLLPEDIGMMVANLRKVVGTAIMASSKPAKEKKDKKKQMTPEELKAALEDEDF